MNELSTLSPTLIIHLLLPGGVTIIKVLLRYNDKKLINYKIYKQFIKTHAILTNKYKNYKQFCNLEDVKGAADGGCETDVVYKMNEGYRAWGLLKSVLSNRRLGINAKKCPYEGVIHQRGCTEQRHGV